MAISRSLTVHGSLPVTPPGPSPCKVSGPVSPVSLLPRQSSLFNGADSPPDACHQTAPLVTVQATLPSARTGPAVLHFGAAGLSLSVSKSHQTAPHSSLSFTLSVSHTRLHLTVLSCHNTIVIVPNKLVKIRHNKSGHGSEWLPQEPLSTPPEHPRRLLNPATSE